MNLDITIEYFALFREQAGKHDEKRVIQDSKLSNLFSLLTKEYGFQLGMDKVQVAVNEEFVDWEYQLKSGDVVVFIPPVAGG